VAYLSEEVGVHPRGQSLLSRCATFLADNPTVPNLKPIVTLLEAISVRLWS
jgi:hypothetical protein